MVKMSERQIQINTQFNDDMADVKTQQLFLGQALGLLDKLLSTLYARLEGRQLLDEQDLADFKAGRRALEALRRGGLRMSVPEEPGAKVYQVTCPSCQAKIRAKPGQRLTRCDWCGHQFSEVEE